MKGFLFTIKLLVANYIPHETVYDRNPPWINTQIKNLINDKKILQKYNSIQRI